MDLETVNDVTFWAGHNYLMTIDNDLSFLIKHDEYLTVDNSLSEIIHSNLTLTVDKSLNTTVGNNMSVSAGGSVALAAPGGVRLNSADTSLYWGSGAKLWPDQGGAMELGDSLTAASVPYVDFHYGVGSSQDFNVRLMNDADNQLTLYGNQQITGNLSFGAGTRQMINLYPGNLHAIGVQNATTYFRSSSRFSWFQNGVHANGENDPSTGGTVLMTLNSGGLTVKGTLVSSSDRNVKENFQPISTQDILQKVAGLPLSRWNYKEDQTSEHIGPMAQDFYAAFNVGPDDKHIAVVMKAAWRWRPSRA